VRSAGVAISLGRQCIGYVYCEMSPHHPPAEKAAQMFRRAGKGTCRPERVVFDGGCCGMEGGGMAGAGLAGVGGGCVAGCAAAGVGE
jgi:hypothetical protein